MSTKKAPTTTLFIEEKAPEQFVFVLIDQQPTNYVREEDPENEGKATKLSAGDRFIPRESVVRHKNANGDIVLRKTRYIAGCDTFFVDEQEKQGMQPNHLSDSILFVRGQLVVRNEENGVSLANYLRFGCSANRDNPNRTGSYKPIFHELKIQDISVNFEKDLDMDYAVMDYMSDLKRKETFGSGVVYNSNRLEFLANLFSLPPFVSGYGSSEAWVALSHKGKENPAKFMDTIRQAALPIEQAVNLAIQAGVIQMDTEKAFLMDEKNTVILERDKTASEDDTATDLVDFFLNPQNRKLLGVVEKLNSKAIAAQTQVIQ